MSEITTGKEKGKSSISEIKLQTVSLRFKNKTKKAGTQRVLFSRRLNNDLLSHFYWLCYKICRRVVSTRLWTRLCSSLIRFSVLRLDFSLFLLSAHKHHVFKVSSHTSQIFGMLSESCLCPSYFVNFHHPPSCPRSRSGLPLPSLHSISCLIKAFSPP